jgi:hypothetical protein
MVAYAKETIVEPGLFVGEQGADLQDKAHAGSIQVPCRFGPVSGREERAGFEAAEVKGTPCVSGQANR